MSDLMTYSFEQLLERVQILEKHIESQDRMLVERTARLEQMTKERDQHKRIRKQITRQLKDVEKARKQESAHFYESFTKQREEIQRITKDYKKQNVGFWSKLFGG